MPWHILMHSKPRLLDTPGKLYGEPIFLTNQNAVRHPTKGTTDVLYSRILSLELSPMSSGTHTYKTRVVTGN